MSEDGTPLEYKLLMSIAYPLIAMVVILFITNDFWVAFCPAFVYMLYLVIYKYRLGR